MVVMPTDSAPAGGAPAGDTGDLWTAAPSPPMGRKGGAVGDAPYPGGMDDYWVAVLWTLLPTIVVSAIFFFVLRSIIRADRTERREYARIEAEERAKRGLPPATGTTEPAPVAER